MFLLSLLVACVSLPAVGAQSPADPAADLFARDRILQIDIRLPDDVWHEMRLSHRNATDETLSQIAEDAYEYRRGDVTIDGVRIGQVGVRKKGFVGSAVSTRPSLKIKFDEFVDGQLFSGIDRITLNNNNQDQTLVQQYLVYDLFERAGVATPRANLAHVRVNGEDLGVYTHIESIAKDFLRRAFGNSSGVLWEGYAGDFSEDRFYRIVEKRGGKNDDRSAVGALKEELERSEPIRLSRVEELVDLDGFIRMWAVESLVGHWDGYSGNRNNYYLYANPATEKLHFIPWGADSVFADPGPLRTTVVPRSFKAAGVLCQRLWELPEVRERYRDVMRELLAGPWDEARMLGEMTAMQETLRPLTALRAETIELASEEVRLFIESRRSEVEPELTAPGPDWPEEAMAAATAEPVPMTITGSFTAPWAAEAPLDPMAAGSGTLEVHIGGQPIPSFDATAAFAFTHDQTGPLMFSPIRETYPGVTLTGVAGADVWQLTFTIDPFRFESAGPLPVDHFAVWATMVVIEDAIVDGALVEEPESQRVSLFGIVGELQLDQAEARPGGSLRGTFTLRGFAPR